LGFWGFGGEEEEDENEMEEYEPASSEEDVKRDHDYDYKKKEFLNPIIVKLPDGSLNIATESKDPNIKEVLCWNCKSRLLYQAKYDTVSCHSCNEIVITKGNNSRNTIFVKCLNCEVDLLVSDGAYKVFCTRCGNIFTVPRGNSQNRTDYLHFFMN
jgi:ribosomal protein S27E